MKEMIASGGEATLPCHMSPDMEAEGEGMV